MDPVDLCPVDLNALAWLEDYLQKCARPRLFFPSSFGFGFGFGFGCRRPTSGQPTNHLDLEGLDTLILALNTRNGGVIVISHDERFITSVARGVRYSCCYLIFATLTCSIQTALGVWGWYSGKVFKGDLEAYKVCWAPS
jgi:hypothetical protein